MRALFRCLRHLLLTVLAGGFLSATLVRFTPGYGSSEEQLDTRRGSASIARLLAANREPDSLPRYYIRFLARYASGDLGRSQSLEQPVRDLILQRIGPTAAAAALGLSIAWGLSALLGLLSLISKRGSAGLTAFSSGALQCLPAGIVALVLFLLDCRGPVAAGVAMGILIYPRVSQYSLNILHRAWESPHVTLARAKGLGEWRVLRMHVAPSCLPQMAALLGLSAAAAMGAIIPVEAILDVPGLGQLAWQAALARDLNLLVNISVLMTLIVGACGLLAQSAGVQLEAGTGAATGAAA